MKNHNNDRVNSVSIVLFIAVILIIIFVFPLPRKIPEGLPNSYYDYVDQVTENESIIFVYSDSINLNEHVKTFPILELDNTPLETSDKVTYIIIDMIKYTENYTSNSLLISLIENTCHRVVIANYRKSDTDMDIPSLNQEDLDADLIFTANNPTCDNDATLYVNSSEFPEEIFLNFAIIRKISDETEED